MAMEINSVYGNYASAYTNPKETKQVRNSRLTSEADKTEGQQTSSVENTKQNENVRKNDDLHGCRESDRKPHGTGLVCAE